MSKPPKPAKPKKPAFVDLHLGPLPVHVINKTLGLELEPGDVVFSSGAQRHAFRSHPGDFGNCLPHVGGVVTKPAYLGDDFKNPGKIELVARIPAMGSGLLVALVIEPDADGRYQVASMYPISARKIENRRQAQHLQICK